MWFLGFSQSNCNRTLLAQIGLRQLTLSPSKLLICAGRKALVVAIEMVNDHGISKNELNRAHTADEDD
jgi:hypothetical protein